MIRLLLREIVLTVALLAAVSVAAFAALDATGVYDWTGTLAAATRAGLPRDRALARDLPALWNRRVTDARTRTLEDLARIADPATRAPAAARLDRRGTAALPTVLAQLHRLPPPARDAALDLLARWAPRVTGGEHPPATPAAALEYWDQFDRLRGLDFRMAYARRQVQRVVDHESRNAVEQLGRLGTFALPAVFDVLDGALDSDSAQRLTSLLADLTDKPLRVTPSATLAETRAVVEAWRTWWLTEHLEYEQLSAVGRFLGHVSETRYGRWLGRALTDRLGAAVATGRPIELEARERVPVSTFVLGLGGLLATALVVAFGGGAALQRRALRVKLLDLTGALVPGLVAFAFAFTALVELCAAPRAVAPLLHQVFAQWPRMALATATMAPLAALWLRRRRARALLEAVRREAESWARESRRPKIGQVLRHGLRVGVASLLAPLGLSAPALVVMGLLAEPLARVRGMGTLSVASLRQWDPPWLLVAIVGAVPLWLGGRWSNRVLTWALEDPATPPTTGLPPVGPVQPAIAPPPRVPA